MPSDLTDLVRRLRLRARETTEPNLASESADALSRLIELEKKFESSVVTREPISKDVWLDLDLPDRFSGKKIRVLIEE